MQLQRPPCLELDKLLNNIENSGRKNNRTHCGICYPINLINNAAGHVWQAVHCLLYIRCSNSACPLRTTLAALPKHFGGAR